MKPITLLTSSAKRLNRAIALLGKGKTDDAIDLLDKIADDVEEAADALDGEGDEE